MELHFWWRCTSCISSCFKFDIEAWITHYAELIGQPFERETALTAMIDMIVMTSRRSHVFMLSPTRLVILTWNLATCDAMKESKSLPSITQVKQLILDVSFSKQKIFLPILQFVFRVEKWKKITRLKSPTIFSFFTDMKLLDFFFCSRKKAIIDSAFQIRTASFQYLGFVSQNMAMQRERQFKWLHAFARVVSAVALDPLRGAAPSETCTTDGSTGWLFSSSVYWRW